MIVRYDDDLNVRNMNNHHRSLFFRYNLFVSQRSDRRILYNRPESRSATDVVDSRCYPVYYEYFRAVATSR